ncbi:MAG: FeoA domain-containing protein [Lachnospiraceae bacterium]|nr:FeoA domain-containing protein [Lachnospiraceae bacterium]
MTLMDGQMGKSYLVKGMALEKATEIRLSALGMTSGTAVLIMNKKNNGSMVIKVRGTRFAIGAKIAGAITVEERQEA